MYLLSSIIKDSSIGEPVEIDGYNFEVVKDFVYLCINTDNDISLEIRRRITLANRF